MFVCRNTQHFSRSLPIGKLLLQARCEMTGCFWLAQTMISLTAARSTDSVHIGGCLSCWLDNTAQVTNIQRSSHLWLILPLVWSAAAVWKRLSQASLLGQQSCKPCRDDGGQKTEGLLGAAEMDSMPGTAAATTLLK